MKICFSWESIVPFNAGAHGDISQVMGMLKGLADRGYEVHFVSLHPGEIKGLGKVIIHQVPNSKNSLPREQKLMEYIAKLHHSINFDIFHFRSQNLVLLTKKHFPDKPCFYTMMPFYFITKNINDFKKEQEVINACDKVVVFTNSWKNYYQKAYSVSPKKLELIRVGVDESIINNKVENKNTPNKSTIGYFGGVREDYGLEPMLNTIAALKQEKKNVWELMIAGTGNKQYLETLKNLTKKLNIQDDVKFLGYIPREEIFKYLSQCSLAVNLRVDRTPDKHRGFDYSVPIKVVEYMLAGVPVVGSNDGGMKELLGRDYPLLVNPHSLKEITTAIKKVSFDPQLRRKIIETNKEKAAPFLNSSVINNYISAYQTILSETANGDLKD